MTNLSRILPILTLVIAVTMMAGCGGPSDADIDATVEARLAQEPAMEATVEARVKEELAAKQVNNLPPNPELAFEYYKRGISYLQSDDWQLANGDITKAIDLGIPTTHPNYHGNPRADAYMFRGHSYAELGQYQPAIADFDKAIQIDPDFAMAYFVPGLSFVELGVIEYSKGHDGENAGLEMYEDAIRDFNKAIELDPDLDADFYINRGNAYADMGQLSKAEADWEKARCLTHKMPC